MPVVAKGQYKWRIIYMESLSFFSKNVVANLSYRDDSYKASQTSCILLVHFFPFSFSSGLFCRDNGNGVNPVLVVLFFLSFCW